MNQALKQAIPMTSPSSLSRRGFLGAALSAPWLSLPLNLDLAVGRTLYASTDLARDRSMIVIHLGGGLSHIDSFDPKPNAPASIRGEFETIATAVPGLQFSEHLPHLARIADQFALLRNVSHSVGEHRLADRQLYTGAAPSISPTPQFGAWIAHRFGWSVPPALVAIPATEAIAGALGPNSEPYSVLGPSSALLKDGLDPTDASHVAHLDRKWKLARSLGRQLGDHATVSQAREESYRRSLELLKSQTMRELMDLEQELPPTRARYGEHHWGRHLLMARRMVEAGSRCALVRFGGFDTHNRNFSILAKTLPGVDQAVSALIEDLVERSLDKRVLVVVLSEFGRTPRVNKNGGRDHWPGALTTLWAGGGTARGAAVGATTEDGSAPVDAVVRPADIVYTLLDWIGITPESLSIPPLGRRVVPDGRAIKELFA